jgi:hypothetical protein
LATSNIEEAIAIRRCNLRLLLPVFCVSGKMEA